MFHQSFYATKEFGLQRITLTKKWIPQMEEGVFMELPLQCTNMWAKVKHW